MVVWIVYYYYATNNVMVPIMVPWYVHLLQFVQFVRIRIYEYSCIDVKDTRKLRVRVRGQRYGHTPS